MWKACRNFQPGEGLLRDCENRSIVCSSTIYRILIVVMLYCWCVPTWHHADLLGLHEHGPHVLGGAVQHDPRHTRQLHLLQQRSADTDSVRAGQASRAPQLWHRYFRKAEAMPTGHYFLCQTYSCSCKHATTIISNLLQQLSNIHVWKPLFST